jgi:arylsulfatase A-like enzyme
MSSRSWLPVVLLAAALSAACPGKPAPGDSSKKAAAPAERPPVILITIDTLRPDHMGMYGYGRATTPKLDAWAAKGAVFEQAYTYWPKTRGSFVAIMTGRTAGESGYSPKHPELHAFNPTLAETLQQAGYDTAAFVDNANVAASLGYRRGFQTYVEMWADASLADEVARTEAITRRGIEYVKSKGKGDGWFLWLHYVNPHAPYTPPAPFDGAFSDRPAKDRTLKVVDGFFGGIPKQWAIPGKTRLSDYVNAYDGEIAYSDTQVDEVLRALDAAGALAQGTVLLSSDHGESLGEHDYYFDHGANLFDPVQRIPFIVIGRGAKAVRSDALVSTLDIMPTLLDLARVSFPAGLAGRSVMPFAAGRKDSSRDDARGRQRPRRAGDVGSPLQAHRPQPAGREVRRGSSSTGRPIPVRPGLVPTSRTRRASSKWRSTTIVTWSSVRRCGRARSSTERPPAAQSRAECEQLKALGYVAECR